MRRTTALRLCTRHGEPASRSSRAARLSGWLVSIGVALIGVPSGSSAGDAPSLVPGEASITDADRQHWSFQPIARPSVPDTRFGSWVRTPLDAFILARLDDVGLRPQPQADRYTLIRRVMLDLTGLPPTPAQVDAFVADSDPGAFERLVDRLLASPAYGRRWAQHWLDLARFAETDGFEHDHVRPQAWRYRDWVIRALNADIPFDEFLALQIAGDELHPDDPQAAVATGFVLAGPDMPDINLQQERRHMVLNEATATIGSVFLGLQYGCAECHDHRFDPISQADFYRLRAFFDNVAMFKKHAAGRVIHETDSKSGPSFVMVRGDFRRPGAKVEPSFPRIANSSGRQPPLPTANATSSGRRSSLARWLGSPENPLTARVIVNRLWQHHFGRGLVGTPSDFGRSGDEPTHPELLDYLATELIRGDWSLKRLHRLLVNSATYRQASRAGTAQVSSQGESTGEHLRRALELDPENRFLARMNRRRLEGEVIRDAMLAAADVLNREGGGPGVMAPLPAELVATLLKDQWKVSPDRNDHLRRSIYLFARRNLRYPMFEVFDRPDAGASCARRDSSTTAPQALYLLNGEFTYQAARSLAAYVTSQAGTDPQRQVNLAFRRTVGRPADEEELGWAAALMAAPGNAASAPADETALIDLCRALFNTSEFVYVD